MATYEIEVPEGTERGIEIRCPDHGESTYVQPGLRSATFACHDCGIELTVTAEDLDDWRDLGEFC